MLGFASSSAGDRLLRAPLLGGKRARPPLARLSRSFGDPPLVSSCASPILFFSLQSGHPLPGESTAAVTVSPILPSPTSLHAWGQSSAIPPATPALLQLQSPPPSARSIILQDLTSCCTGEQQIN